MFLDLTSRKLLVMGIVVFSLILAIAVFVTANGLWAVVAQSEYAIARSFSGITYSLRFGADDGASATTTALAKSIPVLVYHGESGGPSMPLAIFVSQMRALKDDGWHTITMEQFDEWERGAITLPDKSFLLTFDDGRKDTFYPVDPVLQDLGFNAIMFVITGFSFPQNGKQSTYYLNKTELSNMIASGRWELESHGYLDHALYSVQSTTDLNRRAQTVQGHFLSNKFWKPDQNRFETDAEFAARIQGDLEASKAELEQDFGVRVLAFAFPFNDYGQDSVNFPGSEDILSQAVSRTYAYSFYQSAPADSGNFNYPGSTHIKRIEPDASWQGSDLLNALDSAREKPLPYKATTFGQEWVGTWGDTKTDGTSLALAATQETTGASAFLNGSAEWSDYTFTATVSERHGQSISLDARSSGTSYVSCAFLGSRVALQSHTKNAHAQIAASNTALPQGTVQLGIRVHGKDAACYVNGAAVAQGSWLGMPAKGEAGFEVWDPTHGAASARITGMSASPR